MHSLVFLFLNFLRLDDFMRKPIAVSVHSNDAMEVRFPLVTFVARSVVQDGL